MKTKTTKIADLCLYVTSGGTPLKSVSSYYTPEEIPWLKTAEVNYNRIYKTDNYISKEGLNHSSAKIIPINSVIIAMYGQGDTAGRVAINKIPLATNQACCNLVIDPGIADYEYVYYFLFTLYDQLVSLKNGGAQPNLNASKIKEFNIPLPDLKTQHKISKILSAYDHLIENNKKQIKLLEEATQRLYQEWFVDLRFPGYENTPVIDGVPEGWRRCELGSISNFRRGKTITKKQTQNGNIPVVAGGLEPAYFHNESNTTAPVITVSASGANAGFTRLYYVDVFASDCSFVDVTSTDYIEFTYCLLKRRQKDLRRLQKGSAQPHVYPKDINGLSVLFPSPSVINHFTIVANQLFTKIGVLEKQCESAKEGRERLLPKLMSGELIP